MHISGDIFEEKVTVIFLYISCYKNDLAGPRKFFTKNGIYYV